MIRRKKNSSIHERDHNRGILEQLNESKASWRGVFGDLARLTMQGGGLEGRRRK
jgi:hypothetical protein